MNKKKVWRQRQLCKACVQAISATSIRGEIRRKELQWDGWDDKETNTSYSPEFQGKNTLNEHCLWSSKEIGTVFRSNLWLAAPYLFHPSKVSVVLDLEQQCTLPVSSISGTSFIMVTPYQIAKDREHRGPLCFARKLSGSPTWTRRKKEQISGQ